MNERASKRIVNTMLLPQLMEAHVGETHPQSQRAAPRMRRSRNTEACVAVLHLRAPSKCLAAAGPHPVGPA